jgi:hypothetical protein
MKKQIRAWELSNINRYTIEAQLFISKSMEQLSLIFTREKKEEKNQRPFICIKLSNINFDRVFELTIKKITSHLGFLRICKSSHYSEVSSKV